jgi:tetratricopeptide (TPR) repeat protein
MNALPILDAVCVSDTGSTDNTINKVNNVFSKINIPGKIYNDEWKNFGHNRSLAFLNTVDYCKELGWDLNQTYGLLLDGDMELVVKKFDKNSLNQNGYRILQSSGHLEYYNVRFVKLGFPWKCTGVTHEYWDGDQGGQLNKDKLYINDVGDGGCKSDKFQRDIRLLENGIKEEPNNVRYYFYLAQSYKDIGQFKKAIGMYKQRIKMGGWLEEVWYSYYMISKCWLLLYDEENKNTNDKARIL